MVGLRQVDMNLLCQLWSLNESIQVSSPCTKHRLCWSLAKFLHRFARLFAYYFPKPAQYIQVYQTSPQMYNNCLQIWNKFIEISLLPGIMDYHIQQYFDEAIFFNRRC